MTNGTHKTPWSLKDLIQTGRLGPVRRGFARQELHDALGPPNERGGTSRKCPEPSILVYEGIEFHFSRDGQLCLIHSEDLACPAIQIDRWIITPGLTTRRLKTELSAIGVRFCEGPDQLNPGHIQVETETGTRFLFAVLETGLRFELWSFRPQAAGRNEEP